MFSSSDIVIQEKLDKLRKKQALLKKEQLAVEQEIEQNKKLHDKQTMLKKFCFEGNAVLVKQLLDENIEIPSGCISYSKINTFRPEQLDPINCAILGDHDDILRMLFTSENWSASNESLQGELVEAILLSASRCAIYLINEGISPIDEPVYSYYRESGSYGGPVRKELGQVLGLAIDLDLTEIALLLIQKGADVNQTYGKKEEKYSYTFESSEPYHYYKLARGMNTTALILAAEKGNVAVVKALLDRGADAQIRDCNGKTALELTQDDDIIKLLNACPNKLKVIETLPTPNRIPEQDTKQSSTCKLI